METLAVVESIPRAEPNGATSLSANQAHEIERLAHDYQFRDGAAVSSFLLRHTSLSQLLRETHQQIKTVFGCDTAIALEVFTDPESDDGQQLFALIQTALPVDAALAQLQRLDQTWWLDAAPAANGLFNLDVEYV
jgi:hypothetical protein